MYACTLVCMHVYTYVYMYICMHLLYKAEKSPVHLFICPHFWSSGSLAWINAQNEAPTF